MGARITSDATDWHCSAGREADKSGSDDRNFRNKMRTGESLETRDNAPRTSKEYSSKSRCYSCVGLENIEKVLGPTRVHDEDRQLLFVTKAMLPDRPFLIELRLAAPNHKRTL